MAFDDDEMELLRIVLAKTVVEKRTGEVGIMHDGRFVGTRLVLKKEGRSIMDKTFKKLGLPGIVLFSR